MFQKENEIKIRPYKDSDQEAVLHLLRLNTPKFFAAAEEEDFIKYLKEAIDWYFVVTCESEIVGCGGVNFPKESNEARISWDIFHPAFQGKSLGKQLLQYRIELIQSQTQIKEIIVRTSNLAWQFYQKQGFKLISIHNDYWAKGLDMYKMKYAP